jgi:predicted DCC family thiol-disulfide oxidoreductase YuxK
MTTTLNNLDRDTIYYDSSCGVCSAGVRRTQRILEKRGFRFEPLQSEGATQVLGLSGGEIPDEIKVSTRAGAILGGADAMVYICRRIWWAWPVWLISNIPCATSVFRFGYRIFARNRQRISGACKLRA